MRVELLYWEGDPRFMETRQRLVEVLTEDAFETPIQMVAVASREDAELLSFPGSPTIRLDGHDIDPEGAARPPALVLRPYPHESAAAADSASEDPQNLPSRELIRRAVEAARGWGHGRPMRRKAQLPTQRPSAEG